MLQLIYFFKMPREGENVPRGILGRADWPRVKEIDRAHRSHSTREAKQNKANKKNQGSPIKTIKSHDSILVPLLGRGVFTAGFAPPRPFPTPTYKCVGGSRSPYPVIYMVANPLRGLLDRKIS